MVVSVMVEASSNPVVIPPPPPPPPRRDDAIKQDDEKQIPPPPPPRRQAQQQPPPPPVPKNVLTADRNDESKGGIREGTEDNGNKDKVNKNDVENTRPSRDDMTTRPDMMRPQPPRWSKDENHGTTLTKDKTVVQPPPPPPKRSIIKEDNSRENNYDIFSTRLPPPPPVIIKNEATKIKDDDNVEEMNLKYESRSDTIPKSDFRTENSEDEEFVHNEAELSQKTRFDEEQRRKQQQQQAMEHEKAIEHQPKSLQDYGNKDDRQFDNLEKNIPQQPSSLQQQQQQQQPPMQHSIPIQRPYDDEYKQYQIPPQPMNQRQQQQNEQSNAQKREGMSQRPSPQQRLGPPQEQRLGPPQQRGGQPQQRGGQPQQQGGQPRQRGGPPQQRGRPPQQYGYRPPPGQKQYIPRGRMPPQQQKRPPQSSSLFSKQQQLQKPLRTLWRKIERGLDGLADMEDAVTNKAQQLLHYTTATATSLSSTATKSLSSTVTKKDIPSKNDNVQSNLQEKAKEKFNKIDSKNSTSSDRYGVVIEQTIIRKPESSEKGTQTDDMSRQIDWNSIRTKQQPRAKTHDLVANGGALHAPESKEEKPPSSNEESKRSFGSAAVQTDKPQVQKPTLPSRPQPSTTTSPAPRSRPITAIPQTSVTSMEQKSSPRRRFPDEDEETWLASKLGKFIPPIPRLPRLFGRGSSKDFANAALDAWKADDDEESRAERRGVFRSLFGKRGYDDLTIRRSKSSLIDEPKKVLTAPISALMDRCENASDLLSDKEKEGCRKIGKQKAFYDFMFLTFLVAGIRTFPSLEGFRVPHTVVEALTVSLTDVIAILASSFETWSALALMSAYLTAKTRQQKAYKKEVALFNEAGSAVREESLYGTLYLRLVSSASTDRTVPRKMEDATYAQLKARISNARARTFVTYILLSFLFLTASTLHPLLTEVFSATKGLVTLKELRTWPLQYSVLFKQIQDLLSPIWAEIAHLFGAEVREIVQNPLVFAYRASIFVAMITVTLLPLFERKRAARLNVSKDEVDEEVEEKEVFDRFTELVSGYGASGANRLSLLAVEGRASALLERWRLMTPSISDARFDMAFKKLLRLAFYATISGLVLAAPLSLFRYSDALNAGTTTHFLARWDSIVDMAVILLLCHRLVMKAVSDTVVATDMRTHVSGFLTSLKTTVDERKKLLTAPPANLQLLASVSPTAGLSVKDFWASHVTKRAWATRGANLDCKNGEILVILGDDSAGKTRLLTTLAEAIISPPKASLTSQRVRGSISVGGLEVSKWENNLLRKRVGILLNDVRSLGDTAQILTGLSLEEILDPCSGLSHIDPSHSPGPRERSAMMLSLKMTGLYSTLFRRLPSKMATIVTANEDDLLPSPIRPRYQMLSPAEWSKLLIARVLAQVLYDSDNTVGKSDTIESSLLGSVLLLDDFALQLSEVEEARLLKDLRSSGAATVLTSTRWATGRFADRIAVVKDGSIVETGTHSELLNRGPQHSVYAAKWHAMTNAS